MQAFEQSRVGQPAHRSVLELTSPVEIGQQGKLAAVGVGPTSPVPEKLQELQMEAVQSLLGLSSVCGGSGGRSAWAHWEHSGRSRADASVRKKLTPGDVAKSRLRVPGPLFELLFGQSAKVVLQAAPTGIGHFIAASAAQDRKGYLLQGESVRQLFSDLNAELEDVIQLSHKGATADGTPIALCAIAKADPAAREAAAAAAAARSAARSAAGSPASPEPGAAGAAASSPGVGSVADLGSGWSSDEDEGFMGPAGLGSGGLGSGGLLGMGASGTLSALGGPLGAGAGLGSGDYDEPPAPCTVSAAEGAGAAGLLGPLLGAGSGAGGDAASAGGCGARGAGSAGGGGPLDDATAEAAAALAAAADDEVDTGNVAEDAADPEWQARPKARGRPRKRRPSGAAAAAVAQKQRQGDGGGGELVCAHCGTADTPRWWKDNFPMGTLCNACGIWLKRHGYPRPVQFFVVQPGGTATAGPPRPAKAGGLRRDDGGPSSSSRLADAPPPDVEFYLINGRPKRRRTAQGSTAGGGAAAPSSSNVVAPGGLRLEAAQSELQPDGAGGLGGLGGAAASDPAINYEAAGGRVFVVRRKLLKEEDGRGTAAALVHFGWAPSSRAAHEMYDRVVRYSEGSSEVTVDDYELLSDCKATATLQLRPGAEQPPSWDGLVKGFVDSL